MNIMEGFVKVTQASEIPQGEGRSFEVNGIIVAIFNIDGTFHALDGTCPHQGGPLGEGSVDGKNVMCPWHAWEFDVTSGACLGNPRLIQRKFSVKVEGQDIFVQV